ncbi:MFS transporter, partial [Streptomyces sp. NPDC057654]
GYARRVTGVSLLVITVSYASLQLGGHNVLALALGVAFMDLGCQGAHLSNQSVIYRLRPGAHSRVNTAYMTSYFIGGAIGSGLSSTYVYPHFGWTGVCVLGGAFSGLGLLVWWADR